MSDRLGDVIRRLRAPASRPDLAPGSAYEALLDQRLHEVTRELAEVKSRVNGLLFMVLGGVVADAAMRFIR